MKRTMTKFEGKIKFKGCFKILNGWYENRGGKIGEKNKKPNTLSNSEGAIEILQSPPWKHIFEHRTCYPKLVYNVHAPPYLFKVLYLENIPITSNGTRE